MFSPEISQFYIGLQLNILVSGLLRLSSESVLFVDVKLLVAVLLNLYCGNEDQQIRNKWDFTSP